MLTPPGFDDGDGGDGEDADEYLLVVEIHGGPHAMWTTAGSMWQEFRALAAAGDVETPTLLLHAEADYRVPVCNAEYPFRLLRKAGVDTRLERIVRWFDGYSAHHDAARALDRDPGAGLSAGADGDVDGDESGSGNGNARGDDADA